MANKKSKMRGIPPRVRSKYEHKGFYDNPTKLKNASDGRYGDLPLVFNEQTTLTESRNTSPYISGTSIVVPAEFVIEGREQEYNGGGLVSNNVLKPYKDSSQYALDYFLNTGSAEYELLVSGTPTKTVRGFGQPVWSKSKFEISLPSTMTHAVTFSISQSSPLWGVNWANYIPFISSTGSSVYYSADYVSASITGSTYKIFDHLTGALGRSYPMMYYNFSDKTWEPIGKGWTLCCSFLPSAAGELDPTISPGYVGSHEHATIGFSPSILNYFEGKQRYLVDHRYAEASASYYGVSNSFLTSSIKMSKFVTAYTASNKKFSNTTWEEMYSAGQPIDDFGFPFAAKYHATSSQTIKMSNYIKRPFAVERIAVEFENVEYTLFDTAYNMLPDTATTDPYYSNFITSSISPGVVNNFFILNQRRNQKLDSKLLLASLYSTLYEGIYKGLQKSVEGYIKTFWQPIYVLGITVSGPLYSAYDGDYKRALAEFSDTFAPAAVSIAQYYFEKLPLQLTLPLETSLTFEELLTGRKQEVDTIREIITWGGITSFSSEATQQYNRDFITLSESITNDPFSILYGSALLSGGTGSLNTGSFSNGLSSPWVRSVPLYRFLIDVVKKKGIKAASNVSIGDTGEYGIYSQEDAATLMRERIPGLTIQQSRFLANSFTLTASNIIPRWVSEPSAWQQKYIELFSGSAWDMPLTQTLSPSVALARESVVYNTSSLATTRLPAMSFSKSVTMLLPSKTPASTRFDDFDTFLWQPNNPADIHPVFCTSTHASFELGGRNGLGAIHMTDREPESGFTNTSTILNSELEFLGALFGNVVDGEVEEHALYSGGNLFPRTYNFSIDAGDLKSYYLVQAYLTYLGYATSTVISNGQYYVQVRKMYNTTNANAAVYKKSFYSDTPYILFPADELVFGWQQPIPRDVSFCNWVSQSYYPQSISSSTPAPGIVDISCIKLGSGKVVFYGSEIALGNEKHDTLNQYLTAGNVTEPIE